MLAQFTHCCHTFGANKPMDVRIGNVVAKAYVHDGNLKEFDFRFTRAADSVMFEIHQYPTYERDSGEKEIVFFHTGTVRDVCNAFAKTFVQLYKDRDTDEFEFNWRQPFPFAEYEEFRKRMK